jgi:hypothetical protein
MHPGHKSSKKPSDVQCTFCLRYFDFKGIGRHRQACEQQHQLDIQQKTFEKKKAKESKVPTATQTTLAGSTTSTSRSVRVPKPWEQFGRLEPDSDDDRKAAASSSEIVDRLVAEQHTVDPPTPHKPSTGDIKIEYHPNSKRPPEIIRFKDYQDRRRKIKAAQRPTMKRPWKPFQNRVEFEFAEIALKSSLTKNQVDGLIQIIKSCIDGKEKFEIHSHTHLCEIWDAGAVLHTATFSQRNT